MNFIKPLIFIIVVFGIIFAIMYFPYDETPSVEESELEKMKNLYPGEFLTEDTEEGEGREVVQGDSVEIHYIGTLENGEVFDDSIARSQPRVFTVGEGEVAVEGLDIGVIGMKEGGTRVITVPPELGYGSRPQGPIPPDSTLIFEVELLSIDPRE